MSPYTEVAAALSVPCLLLAVAAVWSGLGLLLVPAAVLAAYALALDMTRCWPWERWDGQIW